MANFRTKLKKYYRQLWFLTAIAPAFAFASGLPFPGIDGCRTLQCQRFLSWGYSMDIATHADAIKKIMEITNIETTSHTGKTFEDATNSNWGAHNTGIEFSEHKLRLLAAISRLGMNTGYNELADYSVNGSPLYIIILGGHPRHLCAFLLEISQMRHSVRQTILIGSTAPAYESKDYLNCAALNSRKLMELWKISEQNELSSEKDIMRIYFNDPGLNAIFPVNSDSQQGEVEASFSNNRLMESFLKNNAYSMQSSSVIIAAPQPYMPEAVSIIYHHLRNVRIYRFSIAGNFSVYESLNALRSWLRTDRGFSR